MPTIPAVAYVRRSSDSESQTDSIPQQMRELEEYAAEKGYKIIRWYRDDAVSGNDTESRWTTRPCRGQNARPATEGGRGGSRTPKAHRSPVFETGAVASRLAPPEEGHAAPTRVRTRRGIQGGPRHFGGSRNFLSDA